MRVLQLFPNQSIDTCNAVFGHVTRQSEPGKPLALLNATGKSYEAFADAAD